jgi:rRNA maturation protein Nop10
MKCPKCGGEMTLGAPHCEEYALQWECHSCGKIVGIPREIEEGKGILLEYDE